MNYPSEVSQKRSPRYELSLADENDDSELRKILASNPMGEGLQVSFRREPNYFNACSVQGDDWQIIKCTDTETGSIVALASHFILNTWVNGKIEKTGYLADLRINQSARKRNILFRGYQFLETLHTQQDIKYYYSLILSNNTPALKILTSKRARLPDYSPIGRVYSPAIFLDLPKPPIRIPGVSFRQAEEGTLDDVLKFVREQSSTMQFAPVFDIQQFGTGRFFGLKPENIFYAEKGGKVVATLAVWNQEGFRQTHIEKYSAGLNFAKPFINALANFTPLKSLPKVGSKISYVYFAMMHAKDNNKAVFSSLLRHVYRHVRREPWHYAIAGMHEQNPLLSCLLSYRHIHSSGELFNVSYANTTEPLDAIDDRVPHIEMAII